MSNNPSIQEQFLGSEYNKEYNRIYRENLYYDTTEYLKIVTRKPYKSVGNGILNYIDPLSENRLSLRPGVIFIEKESQRHCMIIGKDKTDYLIVDFEDDSYAYYIDDPRKPKGYAFNTYKADIVELNSEVAYNKRTGILKYSPHYSFINIKILSLETDLEKKYNIRSIGFTHFPRYLIKKLIRPSFFELVRNIFTHATIGDYEFAIDWFSLSTNNENRDIILPEGIINVRNLIDLYLIDDEDGFVTKQVTIEELFTNYALSNKGKSLESLVIADLVTLKTNE